MFVGFKLYFSLAMIVSMGCTVPSYSIVSSNPAGEETNGINVNLVPPGTAIYGDLILDGVAQINFYVSGTTLGHGFAQGTGVRLKDSNYVLTAAHVVDDLAGVNGPAFYDGVEANFRQNGLPLPSHSPLLVPVRSSAFVSSNIKMHPNVDIDFGLVDVNNGFDVALIKFSHIPDDIPGYGLSTGVHLPSVGVVTGYGGSGYGDNLPRPTDSRLRAGLNHYESHPDAFVAGIFSRNRDTQMAMDVDKPNDASRSYFDLYGVGPIGLGEAEVGFQQGDSGGPTFFIKAANGKLVVFIRI